MKIIKNLTLVAIAALVVSCGSEESNEESSENGKEAETTEQKFDTSSPEYRMAEVLCDCFVSFNENDPQGQLEAVNCMMEAATKDESINTANEEETLEILGEICPETAEKVNAWMDNLK